MSTFHREICVICMTRDHLLPSNTMIFHLKRFELNYETFMHEKLNNRFEMTRL